MGRVALRAVLRAAVLALLVSGCGATSAPTGPAGGPASPTGAGSTTPTGTGPTSAGPTGSGPAASKYTKVLIIAEENHSYGEVIGDPAAPYIASLAATYGTATAMDAGYPAGCPSLAAYILLTSGSTHGICDDRDPSAHPLSGPSIFSQVAAAGKQWRGYAEDAPGNCAMTNAANGRFAVRHTPPPYYTSEASRCASWDVPMGTTSSGALRDDVASGKLPAYAFVTPNLCNDMHGAPACSTGGTAAADAWLRQWLPMILAGPDYTARRLVIIVTWDEGTSSDNHIPTLVISPTTHQVRSAAAFTHCSTLRTVEEILGLGLLGCAASAPSMMGPFHLAGGS